MRPPNKESRHRRRFQAIIRLVECATGRNQQKVSQPVTDTLGISQILVLSHCRGLHTLPCFAQSQRALEAFLGRRPLPESRRADVKSGQRRRFWELRGRLALRLFTTFAKVVMYGRLGSPRYKQIITRKSREVLALAITPLARSVPAFPARPVGSAFASCLSGPSRCPLALRPTNLQTTSSRLLSPRLQPLRYLHGRWDSYPAETTLAGAAFSPAGTTDLCTAHVDAFTPPPRPRPMRVRGGAGSARTRCQLQDLVNWTRQAAQLGGRGWPEPSAP